MKSLRCGRQSALMNANAMVAPPVFARNSRAVAITASSSHVSRRMRDAARAGDSVMSGEKRWYPEQDLNLHSLRNQILSLACLPIPPSGRVKMTEGKAEYCTAQ